MKALDHWLEAPRSILGLTLYRQFLAVWTIAFYVPRLPYVEELYARDWFRLALFDLPAPPLGVAWGVVLVTLVACAVVILRPRLRAATVIVALGIAIVSTFDVHAGRAYGPISLIQWALLIILPHEVPLTVSCEAVRRPAWESWLPAMQLGSIYAFTVGAKAIGGWGWWDGVTVQRALTHPLWGQGLLFGEGLPQEAAVAAGITTLVVELFIGLAFIFRRALVPASILLVGLHLGLVLTMRVSPLFHTLMAGHLLLLVQEPRTIWRRWFELLEHVPGAEVEPDGVGPGGPGDVGPDDEGRALGEA